VLKVYLDGSGKASDPACHYITLASIFASDAVWTAFVARWSAVLEEHRVSYSHMNELLRGAGPFARWDDRQKIAFVKDLLNCLSHEDRASFIGCSLTVCLDDYRKLAGRNVKPVEAICVDVCMTYAFGHPDFQNGCAEVFFDRGERFMHWMKRIWSENTKNASLWARYISTIAPVDMSKVIPIQAADLLAWAANRYYNSEEQYFWKFIHWMGFIEMAHYHGIYREADLTRHPGFSPFVK
jgi:hypothetical protein